MYRLLTHMEGAAFTAVQVDVISCLSSLQIDLTSGPRPWLSVPCCLQTQGCTSQTSHQLPSRSLCLAAVLLYHQSPTVACMPWVTCQDLPPTQAMASCCRGASMLRTSAPACVPEQQQAHLCPWPPHPCLETSGSAPWLAAQHPTSLAPVTLRALKLGAGTHKTAQPQGQLAQACHGEPLKGFLPAEGGSP